VTRTTSRWTRAGAALALALAFSAAPAARADGERIHQGRLVRVAAGPATLHESWHPSGGTGDAVHTGWGPALDVTVGAFVRPRLVLAGSLQLAGIINRDETTLGMTYALDDTLHFVDALAGLIDFYPDPRRGLHAGGSLGVAAITELDTHMGGTQTSFGPVAALHVGWERFVSRRWSAGGLFRLSFHHYGTDTPPPETSSNGLLASVLLAVTYD
jgi:hypothetical protein